MIKRININNEIGASNPFGDPENEQYYDRLRTDFSKKALRPPKPPPNHYLIECMKMKRQAYFDIKTTVGSSPAESGGIIIGNPNSLVIECFVFDLMAATNRTIYQPNTEFLNSVLKGRGNQFLGISHSHAKGCRMLSQQDRNAAWSNMTSPGNPHLNTFLMPLIQTIPDTGRFEIIPYIVTCNPGGHGRVIVHQAKLEIID